ncbi:gluzincin family metallopeptidase [Costertonia aggregata]|uniref:metalloprotease n=1 Tax=Costertonia aggregata TaxID=343403 RepID=UPI001D158DFB
MLACALLFCTGKAVAQHINRLTANLDGETKELNINQKFTYVNSSADTLNTLYFNDWAHAYSDKNTGLAKRFAEEFKKSLHLAKDDERGYTKIKTAVDNYYQRLDWDRTNVKDIIRIILNRPLEPKDSMTFYINYTVKLPPNKYTAYGYSSKNGYFLKDWYLTPAVYNGKWQLYSNKNLEDLYTGITNTTINFIYPKDLYLTSNFVQGATSKFPQGQSTILKGENRKSCEIVLQSDQNLSKHITKHVVVLTDIETTKYDDISQNISIERTMAYIHENLGEYPHKELLVSTFDYNKDPLYGINQLPSFIRPYEPQFQFELKFLKTALRKFLEETLFTNPRKEKWVNDAILNYLMIKYVDQHYPGQKLLGKLSKIWGVRSFHLAQMDFNEQYPFLYMFSARKNLDQSLITPNDSLLYFNQKVANRYKAGLGLAYLAAYIGEENVGNSIKQFYQKNKLKEVEASEFISTLNASTQKNIGWFFNEYVSSDNQIDFKIKKVKKKEDSITVTIKNKTGTNIPISMFGVKKDSVVSKYWFSNIKDIDTFTIPKNGEDRLVLNYDQKIPEFNQRDNWKTLNGFFSSNKKLKFQFLKDSENPYRNQIFYMPVAGFNIYDGLTPGLRLTNKTLLQRPFLFDFAPSYAMKEKSFVGYGSFRYQKYHAKTGFYVSNYSIGGSTFHFQTNSRYSTITPAVSFGWRPDDLLSNKREFLSFRYVNVLRDIDENLDLETDPDYSVLNARYINSNIGIIDYSSWFIDAQHSSNFSKVSFNYEFRKLFENNRQLNLRFFAGKFLRNKTDSDFFSFALDRPTDYLFDYGYLGRSEDTGIYSQQIIIAEGGFKSKLRNPFADDWMATANASFNVWRWIELYGDIGFMKNKGEKKRFVYDSGVRLNLVTDYFELYFPLHSNNGWEISQPNYDEKIRFIVTLSPKVLTGLFTRKWF